MKDLSILHPVLVQVLLTFALLFLMAKERLAAFRAKAVKTPEPGQRPVWPERAATVSNAFHNSLEMPMLFFAAVAFAMLADAVDWELKAMAWGYVAFRILQSAIHVTYNHIPHRFMAFLGSVVMLIAMWVNIALTVLLGW
jgi:hypothetical protein